MVGVEGVARGNSGAPEFGAKTDVHTKTKTELTPSEIKERRHTVVMITTKCLSQASSKRVSSRGRIRRASGVPMLLGRKSARDLCSCGHCYWQLKVGVRTKASPPTGSCAGHERWLRSHRCPAQRWC